MDNQFQEIITSIAELRATRQEQVSANNRIIEEMRIISSRLTSIVELNATFVEYRKSTHERFNKIHEMFAHSDQLMARTVATLDRLSDRLDAHDVAIARLGDKLDSQWKIIATIAAGVSALLAAGSGFFPILYQKLFS